jgi:NADH-quinone oxidoreductase subunit C
MSGQQFVERLKAKFGDAITGANFDAIDPWIEVAPERLVEVCEHLKTDPALRFDMLNCITCVDYWMADEAKMQKAGMTPRLEVVYHLSSIAKKHTLVVKVVLPRWRDGVEGELPQVPTVCGVWRTADWHERETYDLSGIEFVGHPDLKRILCPDDWVGHPLRKDYVQPLEYHGMRGR